ncbi:hypothetical protein ACFLW6_02065 [Chloroflexota bacterium]
MEIVSPDFAPAIELLYTHTRYRQANLFGSTIHVVVEDAATACPDIDKLLNTNNIPAHSIKQVPFSMEDVFLLLVEAQEMSLASQRGQKGD